MRVFVVNGRPASGKTLFEANCKAHLRWCGIFSTIDWVKDIARDCGWDGRKTPESRKFLSDLKDLLTRFNNSPFEQVCHKIEEYEAEALSYDYSADEVVVFVDCREPQEIAKLVERYGAKTILIRRRAVAENEVSNHADANVENYDYDYIIDNNGSFEEYKQQAIDFLKSQGLTKFLVNEVNTNVWSN